jgi:acylphosphatase
MPTPLERRHILFRGRVQGVGFRATTRAVAASHPITGWVRNEPDGSVSMQVQGAAPDIEAFLATLRTYMSRNITQEVPTPMTIVEAEHLFEIRR